MTPELQPQVLSGRAMCERDMIVRDVVEEVDLILVQGEAGSDGVHGRVTPALVEKPAVFVERVKEIEVRLGAQPREGADFEI